MSDIFQPNDALILQDIPSVPMSLVEQVNRYTEFRSASLSSWHPIRRDMLISTRFGDTAQVHEVTMPLGCRSQLTFFPERVSRASYSPKRGEYFVFSKDIGGNEFSQTFRYDVETGTVTMLTDGTSRNSRGIWSQAGDRLCYTSTRRNSKDSDLYVIDPLEPETNRLMAEVDGGGWFPLDWEPGDRRVVVLQYISITESYLWLFDVETGERTQLTDTLEGETVSYQGAAFSPDPRWLYVLCDRQSEFLRLYSFDLETQSYSLLTDDIDWDIESICLSDDGKWLAFTANENGIGRLYVMNTATRERRSLPQLPVGIISGLRWHSNNEDLGFTLISARSTADVYSLNFTTNQLERWTQSETGGLNTKTFSEPELVEWTSFDDRLISGFLYRPPSEFTGKRPVVISIHGGPEGQFRPYFLGRNNFYLNHLGVALLFPNVRGSSGYGKTFLKLDNGYLREDSVRDIGALLDWIATQPDLDSDRILVTGGSYGGYMSLAVATHYGDRISASIDIVGISNFVTFLENTKSYRRDLRRVEYGDERDPAMREFLLSISPVNNADKIKKPLFIIHGANDPRVPLGEADQMASIVRQKDVPVWYLVAKDEGHGFAKKKNADYQFYATILFIKTFLLNA